MCYSYENRTARDLECSFDEFHNHICVFHSNILLRQRLVGCGQHPYSVSLSHRCSRTNPARHKLTVIRVPLYEMWYQGTGSKETATVFISSVALMLVFTSLSIQQTASRLTWSFARDNGILGAEHLKTIHPRLKVPVWALLFDTFWVFLLGCIYLGSSTGTLFSLFSLLLECVLRFQAFNAIVSPGVILEQITFAIPAILLLWRRREPMLFCGPMGPVLGNFGWIANFVTVAWAFVELVFYNMPAQLPATAENMSK